MSKIVIDDTIQAEELIETINRLLGNNEDEYWVRLRGTQYLIIEVVKNE